MDDLRYARTPDGVHIAFRVLPGGNGQPLVYLPGMVYSIESILEDVPYARFVVGLTDLAPVILIERQGIGASDPLDPARDFWEQWVANVTAVLDEMQVQRAPLVGYLIGANIALETALRHPQRVTAVAALHAMVGISAASIEYQHDLNQRVVARDEDAGSDAWAQSVPSRAADPAFIDWSLRAGRLAASPSAAALLWDRVLRVSDLDDRITGITVPVLLMHRRGRLGAAGGAVETTRALVERMPDARMVILDGADLTPNAGDIDGLLFEIAEFLTGDRRSASLSRSVVTILFTDLVGSTKAVRTRGDADWRAVLDHHDRLIERTVRRHGGRVVKSTGDGALATFDAPSRALRCALGLRDSLTELGIGVRMGLHLGEVEQRGLDVAGVAVHLAARVMSTAGDGQILTTAALPLATLGSGFRYESRGVSTLQGFDDEFELFRLLGTD